MKNILITGASRGIGRSIASILAEKNKQLFIHGRDEAALKITDEIVTSKGSKSTQLIADLSKKDGVYSLISELKDQPIDLLINNAGIPVVGNIENISDDDWDKVFAVNVTAPFMLTRALLPRIPKGGAIVNILSGAAKKVFPGFSAYCMTKFALRGFALALREEVRELGIRVINIYPGATATDIWKAIPGEWPVEKMMSPDEVAKAVKFTLDTAPTVAADEVDIGNAGGAI